LWKLILAVCVPMVVMLTVAGVVLGSWLPKTITGSMAVALVITLAGFLSALVIQRILFGPWEVNDG
jgi:flagellar motor component MotA